MLYRIYEFLVAEEVHEFLVADHSTPMPPVLLWIVLEVTSQGLW